MEQWECSFSAETDFSLKFLPYFFLISTRLRTMKAASVSHGFVSFILFIPVFVFCLI